MQKTLYEINQLIDDKKYIFFFHHRINFCVHPACMSNETWISLIKIFIRNDQLNKNFQRKSSLWKIYLAKTGKP